MQATYFMRDGAEYNGSAIKTSGSSSLLGTWMIERMLSDKVSELPKFRTPSLKRKLRIRSVSALAVHHATEAIPRQQLEKYRPITRQIMRN